jgi:stearoyl-CoA desaturase (delta-9 desaturase)
LLNIFAIVVFWAVQVSALLAFRVPFTWMMLGLWAASHFLRAIGLTLSFHRYFAHRAFQMNRGARFVWAFIGTAAMQKGPLWWAGHHVNHHKYADRDGDPHSPAISGVYYAHIGWFLNDARHDRIEASNPVIRDFGKLPEIAWLDRYYAVPPLALAAAMYWIGGLQWLVWGFCVPTMTLAHATFAINTVNHMFGSRRFETLDDSRNNVLTAVFAAGEGWHNNHHRYQRAARNGFYWWEFDPTWYAIRAMAAIGLAWDVRPVPVRIYAEARASSRSRASSRYAMIGRVFPPAAVASPDERDAVVPEPGLREQTAHRSAPA